MNYAGICFKSTTDCAIGETVISNGVLGTSAAPLITNPTPAAGVPRSGNAMEVNFFRVVNYSSSTQTFNLYLNVNGVDQPITPTDTVLPPGAAWDDVPVFQLPSGGIISGQCSDTDSVSWTINSYLL